MNSLKWRLDYIILFVTSYFCETYLYACLGVLNTDFDYYSLLLSLCMGKSYKKKKMVHTLVVMDFLIGYEIETEWFRHII
jgi:hypothetical protein